MRRQLHPLVALCVFSVLGVSTSLMPVASASADQTTPSPATSSSPADVTPPPDARPAGQASATGDPASSAGASTSAQPSPSPSPPSAAGTPLAPFAETTPAAPLNPPITTITSTPPLKSTSPSASFAFTADRAGVTFQCKLSGPGQTDAFEPCDVQPAAGDTTTLAKGSTSYSGLKAGTYTFTVHATPAEPAGSAPGPDAAPYVWTVDDCTTVATLCPVFAPGSYGITPGARFNNPLGTTADRRRNMDHVVAAINSMPGYRVPDPRLCLHDPKLYAGRIRISLYSVTSTSFASAMVAAHRRCISVQILMNNHLSAENDAAIAMMQDELGTDIRGNIGATTVDRRSFARRCSYGCRGTGVLHSKFYLFDSRLTIPGRERVSNVTMVGSSNMTGNATGVQWNDLYTVKNNAALFNGYSAMFDRMKLDQTDLHTSSFGTGPYTTTFSPLTPGGADPTLSALNSIHCTGATGGAGISGRTVVYINMHAWFGTRGYRFAERVRDMYARGCYVRILYSFMSYSVFKKLTAGTGSRMSARRTLFSLDGDKYADVYSHFKMIAVSGVIGSDHSAWAVWTGSNNFTNDGTHFDEVTMKIALRSAFMSYRDRFTFIRDRKSSPTWAMFLEPIGGGRPPAAQETKALRETASFAAQNRSVIVAPDAIAGTSGDVRALD